MQTLVVLSGAGMSAESGIQTFRGAGGLWEGFPVEEVATPEAWARNPEQVLAFYDARRANVIAAKPNEAHLMLKALERYFEVHIVTQNIDDLHERAGSRNVIHLHGEILKSRSTIDPDIVLPISGSSIKIGDLCPLGSQLRPHIVWFGEAVPMMEIAARIVAEANIVLIVGTSMEVYPAAVLHRYAQAKVPIYLIDPNAKHAGGANIRHIVAPATKGIIKFKDLLKQEGWLENHP